MFLAALALGPAIASQAAFTSLGWLGFILCAALGAQSTADAISREKRDGTLGLLFLTDLRSFDIVAGKLAASSLWLFHLLLAAVPILAVPILQGGVSGAAFARQVLVLGNVLFLSGSLGLMVSVVARHPRRARALSRLLAVLVLGLPPLVAGVSRAWSWPAWIGGTAEAFSLANCQAGLNPFTTGASGFWLSLAVTHAVGWGGLGAAAAVLPHVWQDRPASARATRWRAGLRLCLSGDAGARRRRRQRALEANPIYFLAARNRLRHVALWLTLGALGALAFCGWWLTPDGSELPSLIFWTAAAQVVVKCWFAADAVAPLAAERRAGSFELLLSTPLRVREFAAGIWRALATKFGLPVAIMLLATFGLLLRIAMESGDAAWTDERQWFVLTVATTIPLLALDLFALGWTGMWLAVSSRNLSRASSDTVARVLIVPWAGFVLLVTGGLVFEFVRGHPFEPGFLVLYLVWLTLGLGVDFGFGLWSRHCLLREFRVCVSQYQEGGPRSRWEIIARWTGRRLARFRHDRRPAQNGEIA